MEVCGDEWGSVDSGRMAVIVWDWKWGGSIMAEMCVGSRGLVKV